MGAADHGLRGLSRTQKLVLATAVAAVAAAWTQRKRSRPSSPSDKKDSQRGSPPGGLAVVPSKEKCAAINLEFLRRMYKLLHILVPGPFCKESFYLVMVAVMMVTRTLCDVWQIRNGTSIETAIISRDTRGFNKYLGRFALLMVPIAMVNNLLKLGLNELALCFRARLTRHLYKEYLTGFTFYKVTNLDNRISNPDQLLTQDVDKFATSLADLYSNLSKPILDISIYARKLADNVGGLWAPAGMLAYLAASGVFLTWMRRPLGKFTVREQKLEGAFRHVAARIITNSEEIAFYRGNEREADWVEASFGGLEKHIRAVMHFRFGVGMIDTVVAKYMATIVGYYIVEQAAAEPQRRQAYGGKPQGPAGGVLQEREDDAADGAGGRAACAGGEGAHPAGGVHGAGGRLAGCARGAAEGQVQEVSRALIQQDEGGRGGGGEEGLPAGIGPGMGTKVEVDGLIRFTDVPVVTPNHELLVRSLNMEVRRGMNVLICGPNGCGKSSLFRILGDLWPVFGGKVEKPNPCKVFYIPQKPYLSLGTLRDQVTYPHSQAQLEASGRCDGDLYALLKLVNLEYVLDTRDSGWDSREDWADVLSGGEKQKLAMARLFYHRPQFAILDECTSAVSVDVEGSMYTQCTRLGITLLTVSHRKSLWQYHQHVLRFDGEGGATFEPIVHGETVQFG
eukprot:CAMPEP_0172056982 /NCGR_PEP_ID=MMETSP1043-20130122/6094_1 /TAXON_ID=464988 /ORGANISM="Hemiselmis andersenii, Strain CCMP441" /LENGTH=677 /DNA_ID=CAMNT_0012716463 /DNA_START=51 /DNA_END=2079 /DNA_ORIENTATION=-